MSYRKYFEYEQCPVCGDDLVVTTDKNEYEFYDGDHVECVACDFKSVLSVDDEGGIWVQ